MVLPEGGGGDDGGLPSHEGSGLKFDDDDLDKAITIGLPSHEGSGLKWTRVSFKLALRAVSPRMRGVD